MANNKAEEHKFLSVNYLTNLEAPPVTEEHMYDPSKGVKSDFSYVKGVESHLLRRKMILSKYPQIAKLLVADKPWTILIAIGVIMVSMANCYWAKVSIPIGRTRTYGYYYSMPTSLGDSSTTPSTAASTTSPTSEDIKA